MGFFKDMRDLKKLGDHHGGMPSMKQAMSDVRAVADDRGEAEVLKVGRPAKAIVKRFATPVPDGRFAMQVPLEVHPPGGAPYAIDHVFPTARVKAAISVGMEVPVKVRPQHRPALGRQPAEGGARALVDPPDDRHLRAAVAVGVEAHRQPPRRLHPAPQAVQPQRGDLDQLGRPVGAAALVDERLQRLVHQLEAGVAQRRGGILAPRPHRDRRGLGPHELEVELVGHSADRA